MKKKLKNKWLLLLLMFTISLGGFANNRLALQDDGTQKEKIEALRIAYISQQLNLSPDEAQKFWPVYNLYKTDLETLRKNFKPGGKQLSAEEQIDFEQKKLDLKKKYKMQFEGAIGKEKVSQLYNLEDKFRQKLKEVMEKRQERRENMGGRKWGPR